MSYPITGMQSPVGIATAAPAAATADSISSRSQAPSHRSAVHEVHLLAGCRKSKSDSLLDKDTPDSLAYGPERAWPHW
jgi:hypothetical protein